MTEEIDNNIVQFPSRKTKVSSSSTIQFDITGEEQSEAATYLPKYSIRSQMLQDTSTMPALACSKEQRAQLWRIWDLCYQIQKSAMYAVHIPVLANDLERHLGLLNKQIPTPENQVDAPEKN